MFARIVHGAGMLLGKSLGINMACCYMARTQRGANIESDFQRYDCTTIA